MNLPASVLEAQVESLLSLIERERRRRCEELENDGRNRIRTMLRETRARARIKLSEAVQYERSRLQEALQRSTAAMETRRAAVEHTRTQEMLARAWARLPQALVTRWMNPESRRRWCQGALLEASARLREQHWRIDVAPGPDETEKRELLRVADRDGAGAHTLHVQPELTAGLRIVAGGAVLDASLAGLLSDRASIAARLVAEWRA